MSGSCYQPICPVGTYLCCGTCRFSTCLPNPSLALSTRGVYGNIDLSNRPTISSRECIACPSGHFCGGCDIPTRCSGNTINPHVGMWSLSACTKCGNGYVASADATRCCLSGNLCSAPPDGENYLVTSQIAFDSGDVSPLTPSVALAMIIPLITMST